ncbi:MULTISPECIES: DUF3293 domain-containing protein [unclassified Polaromonas]|nr:MULTISPECIES: DUF3293 domain-containing protein [unclassified Polaromonas]MBG6072560.1 hypothetical protein [Polaromonas sp. CG_9.7]MBG6114720.1 hypothetical protein [Polaromonas sp. CG_9.2]
MATLNSEAFKDLAPSQIVPRLADSGIYLASESTMYRLLLQYGQRTHRRLERAAQQRSKPRALAATGPDQVFCWDITYLPTQVRAQHLDYLDTDYGVYTVPPFVIKVGVPSEPLRQLYSQYRSDCAAYITACNPLGRSLSDAENTARQAALLNELTARSLKFINGVGLDSKSKWPGEASFLVMNLSLEATRVLASKYEQNAVVWCDKDAVAQLILLR